MKRLLIISLNLFAVIFYLSAQPAPPPGGTVSGRIIDAQSGSPLEFATVSIYTIDSTLVTGSITGSDGSFSIDLKNGDYYALIQFIAYKEKAVDGIKISSGNRKYDIGTISLEAAVSDLDEVTVVGEKSEMVFSLDKKIFNVGKDLSNTGKSALDIMDNIPSVTVDLDGNISLRGSQSLQILVDGKPSGLVTAGNTEALRSIQGSMIERIEVITNPSARYEAEGMAGIINIVLKKDQQKGVNGSFEATLGYPHEYSLGANVNFRREKINYFVNYNIRYSERPGSGSSDQYFTLPDTSYITLRESERLRSGLSNQLRGGADFYITPKSILTTSVMVSYEDQTNTTTLEYDDFTSTMTPLLYTKREDTEAEGERNIEFALNYDQEFDSRDHKLTAIVQYIEDTETEESDILETMILPDGEYLRDEYLSEIVYNEESEKDFLLQVDYVRPFGNEGKFELGYRSELREIYNPYYVLKEDSLLGEYTKIPEFSDNLTYTENVHAAYLQAGEKFNQFSVQLGLRAEYAEIRTSFSESSGNTDDTYIDLFPTIHTTYEFDPKNSIQLSYSRRINRPHFWLLNPFYSYTDPRNIRSGDPNLKPEYTHSTELGYMFRVEGYDFYSGLYYRYSTDAIERVSRTDTNGITIAEPANFDYKESYGLELSSTLRPAKWMTFTASGNLYREITEGTYNDENRYSDDFTWDARGNLRLRLPENTDFQTIFYIRAPQETTEGSRKAFYGLNMALSKDILKGKGTLTFNVRDVLNSHKWRFEIDRPELQSTNEFQWRSRSYTLTFSYRLNQKKQMGRRGGDGNFEGGDMSF